MRFVNSSVELVPQMPGMIGVYKHIEKAMRNCYKSEDKIDETSYERMLKIAQNKHHYSPLEHGSIYLKVSINILGNNEYIELVNFYTGNPYSRVVLASKDDKIEAPHTDHYLYITTNFRVIVENDKYDDLQYMCEPEPEHERRITFKVVSSIGVSREFNRHRTMSVSEQSTRYCNYSKDKFGSELTYVIPQWMYTLRDELSTYDDSLTKKSNIWMKDENGIDMINTLICHDRSAALYYNSLKHQECDYMALLDGYDGYQLKPQEARGVLPLDTATCVYYTAFISDWKHFLSLRTTQAAHPDIRVIADAIKETLTEQDYI